MGVLAKGRKILENDGGFQLREEEGVYNSFFEDKNEDIAPLKSIP